MLFVGVDLAWGERANTGVCVVADGAVRDSALLRTDDELVAWLEPHVAGDCVVGFDAPLIVRNATGRRRCERLISRCFGAQHAGAHSSNLGMPSFRDGGRAARLARRLDLSADPFFPPGSRVRRALEVYPHPALVALFDLTTTLKYKAKRGRSLDGRRAAFRTLIAHLETLATAEPPLDVRTAAFWPRLRDAIEVANGAELDRLEDELDSYVCAYVACLYWTHGVTRSRVVGDLDDGYIVTPVAPRHVRCLDAAAASA